MSAVRPDRETVLRIYCALLARDPLAQQRFTQLSERFEQMAHLAQSAALQFCEVECIWNEDRARAEAEAAHKWNLRAISVEPILKQPKKLVGVDGDSQLPASQQCELLAETRQ